MAPGYASKQDVDELKVGGVTESMNIYEVVGCPIYVSAYYVYFTSKQIFG